MSNYTSAYVIQSASLAMKIQDEYAKKAGRIDKGVHRQSIWVLWRTAMPSILTEIGYLTNDVLLNYQNFQSSGMVIKKQSYLDNGEALPQAVPEKNTNSVSNINTNSVLEEE